MLTGIGALMQFFNHLFDAPFFLIAYAYPAIRFNGFEFLSSPIGTSATNTERRHDTQRLFGPPGASFGALVFIFGTIVTAALTMVVAVPLSMMVALSLVYRVHAGSGRWPTRWSN